MTTGEGYDPSKRTWRELALDLAEQLRSRPWKWLSPLERSLVDEVDRRLELVEQDKFR